ncbi:hypothetical protein EX895_002146 [Sporisorium graminicola]|uniref:DUF202 domain-containing protein n=1 Tax=Sporisorium graminicola TaxID=280036 RepID=A0A4U7KW10_9BASI|nr:hypothetical protein EX895_002146 [Sporisorium graminicola]TKY88905.1 hypothetical protein EX895_002146 [Sporisorium graminicola]
MSGGASPSEAGLNGLKRINTGLSEAASGHQPRSSVSGSGRLSLHIPNAYPRALSPRTPGSKDATPESSRPSTPSGSSSRQQQQQQRVSRPSVFGALKGSQEKNKEDPDQTRSGSSSRSSSRAPKVRVFRRDSSLITIHHVDDNDESQEAPAQSQEAEVQLSSSTLSGRLFRPPLKLKSFFSTKETSSGSARDFLARERNFFSWLKLSCLLAILSASLILQLQLPDLASTARHGHRQPPKRRKAGTPVGWDELPLTSKAFAGVFFVLSLLSLATGLADYLSAERQLEKEQVDFDETEGVFLNDAHTSRFVHAVMLVVGAGITASALWLMAY